MVIDITRTLDTLTIRTMIKPKPIYFEVCIQVAITPEEPTETSGNSNPRMVLSASSQTDEEAILRATGRPRSYVGLQRHPFLSALMASEEVTPLFQEAFAKKLSTLIKQP